MILYRRGSLEQNTELTMWDKRFFQNETQAKPSLFSCTPTSPTQRKDKASSIIKGETTLSTPQRFGKVEQPSSRAQASRVRGEWNIFKPSLSRRFSARDELEPLWIFASRAWTWWSSTRLGLFAALVMNISMKVLQGSQIIPLLNRNASKILS